MAYRSDVVQRAIGKPALFAAAWAVATHAAAFDTTTHAAMTAKAMTVSSLGTPALRDRLGILDYNRAFGAGYLDMGTSLLPRAALPIEQGILADVRKRNSFIPADFTVTGWLMRGAIREDDNSVETPSSDEPGVIFNRVFGHFFDPVHNAGLSVEAPLGANAVDWALLPGATVGGTLNFPAGQNHFKVGDAIEATWRALTLTSGNGGNVRLESAPLLSDEVLRNMYWATSFRALGDAVHLLQDMAQPQHTRNDAHSGQACASSVCVVGGHTSYFEAYMKVRTLRDNIVRMNGNDNGQAYYTTSPPLEYGGYPSPAFGSYREFFGPAAGSVAANRTAQGLANYSNRNFYTVGTLPRYGMPNDFPSPAVTDPDTSDWVLENPLDMGGTRLTGTSMKFRKGFAYDSLLNRYEPTKLYATSIWDEFLARKDPGKLKTTLNYYIYDDQATLLVPRAVAYTAGFIDFFYRGRLELSMPADGVYSVVDHTIQVGDRPDHGFRKIRVKVRNATGLVAAEPQTMQNGKLIAVVKYHRNTCYKPDLSGEWGAPEMASKGDAVFKAPAQDGCRSAEEEIAVSEVREFVSLDVEPQIFEFNFPVKPIPVDATDVYLQVVYRGPIGREADSIAVETLDIGEPNFVSYMNALDYLFCDNGTWVELGADGQFPPALAAKYTGWSSRFPPSPLTSLKISFEDNPPDSAPLATLDSLLPATFVRLAVLGKLGGSFSDAITYPDGGIVATDGRNLSADPRQYANQVYRTVEDADAATLSESPKKRSVLRVRNYRMTAGLFYAWGAGASCGAPYPVSTNPSTPQPLRITLKGAWATTPP